MIKKASPADIPSLVALLNSAYRGEASKKGWTSEADKIEGDIRTDESQLQELMQTTGAAFFKYIDDSGNIGGCVFLQKLGEKLYLGMLCVSPGLQAKGTGKNIMTVAEEYARQKECTAIFMRVFSFRHELISWYEKQGYYKTGEIVAFENSPYGTASEKLEFLIMEKRVSLHNQSR